MLGWRAKIGSIGGSPRANTQERDRLLPEGVVCVYTDLGVRSVAPEDLRRAFESLPRYGEAMAELEVDFIMFSGSAIWHCIGYEKSLEMIKHIEETTGIPTMINSTAQINALNALSAKKIVVASPFDEERNEERRKFLEEVGFEVLNFKGLELRRIIDIQNLSHDASYRLAREAFSEAPEADAILIDCPVWPIMPHVDMLERDTGKPVVAPIAAELWAALTALHIKASIRGYGVLMETL